MSIEDELIGDAVLKKRVETFLCSDVGQYLIQRISNEIQEGTDELIAADPYNGIQVQKAQNKIKLASSISIWLQDVIRQGIESEARLDEELDE